MSINPINGQNPTGFQPPAAPSKTPGGLDEIFEAFLKVSAPVLPPEKPGENAQAAAEPMKRGSPGGKDAEAAKPARVPTGSPDRLNLAVGFHNPMANCWAISILSSMFTFNPQLRHAYLTIANYYKNLGANDREKQSGQFLLDALEAYDIALATGQAVDKEVSQNVRLAFNVLSKGQFSARVGDHVDAPEAAIFLMDRYEELIGADRRVCAPLEVTEHYEPIAQRNVITPLREASTKARTENTVQLLIDIRNSEGLNFSNLVARYFYNRSPRTEDVTLSNGQVVKDRIVGETSEIRKFSRVPESFFLTLQRFSNKPDGTPFKMNDRIAVPQAVTFSREYTALNKEVLYDLRSFVVHLGGVDGGHYISYKKVGEHWVETNDHRVRFVPDPEIERILTQSYMHFYVRRP